MLVFRNGTWMTVDTSFLADAGLSEGQRRIGAAVAATQLARGRSKAAAEAAAEKAVYAAAYPGLEFCEGAHTSQNRIAGKQHDSPEHKKE